MKWSLLVLFLCLAWGTISPVSSEPVGTAPEDKSKWGYIKADEKTGKTTKKGVWAGGDIVTGSATVILAMGAGRIAANSIHDYLTLGW